MILYINQNIALTKMQHHPSVLDFDGKMPVNCYIDVTKNCAVSKN